MLLGVQACRESNKRGTILGQTRALQTSHTGFTPHNTRSCPGTSLAKRVSHTGGRATILGSQLIGTALRLYVLPILVWATILGSPLTLVVIVVQSMLGQPCYCGSPFYLVSTLLWDIQYWVGHSLWESYSLGEAYSLGSHFICGSAIIGGTSFESHWIIGSGIHLGTSNFPQAYSILKTTFIALEVILNGGFPQVIFHPLPSSQLTIILLNFPN